MEGAYSLKQLTRQIAEIPFVSGMVQIDNYHPEKID
jgi:hypothetical protein